MHLHICLFMLLVLAGCIHNSDNNNSVNWYPKTTFEIDIRPLPPADELYANYREWMSVSPGEKARLYITTMSDPKRQQDYKTDHTMGSTGWGDWIYTTVVFNYVSPSNGTYTLYWELRGKHDPAFLRFSDRERQYLLQPSAPPRGLSGHPRLLIVGIEGVQSHRGVPGRTSKWFDMVGLTDDDSVAKNAGSSTINFTNDAKLCNP